MDINIQPSELWIKKFDSVFQDIFSCRYKNFILPGGRGSTKSSFISLIIPLLIKVILGAMRLFFERLVIP